MDRVHAKTGTAASDREGGLPGDGPTGPTEGAESPAAPTEDGPEFEMHAVDKKPGCRPAPEELPPEAAGVRLSVSPKPPDSEGSAGAPPEPPRPSKASVAEMDCLICFNRYSPCRPPKVLACQHAFCAVCLKLLLRHEERSWAIPCPLCRKATVVFGGLVCSLRDQEEVLDRLEGLALETEVACPAAADLPGPVSPQPVSGQGEGAEATGTTSRAAAKRLVLLLLLVVMLIALVLPFLYTGMLTWALGSVAALGLTLSVVLCCNPRWVCSGAGPCPWQRKESQVAAVA